MRAGRRPAGDEGVTLIELMVTMTIMSVLTMVVTGAIMQVYRTINATETLSTTQAQVQNAFKRLDKELRYASWIATPTASVPSTADPYYVEFALPPDVNGDVQCRQLRLRLDTGVLQLLQWEAGSLPLPAARTYQTLASNVVDNDLDTDTTVGRRPFVLQLADSKPYATTTPDATAVGTSFSSGFYRLRVRLTTKMSGRYIRSDVTFTALNTSRKTATQPVSACSEGRP